MSRFQDILTACGLRCTAQRTAVLTVISNARRPCTAEDIIAWLNTKGSVHRATVYRDLQHFVRHNLLTELSILGSSSILYEPASLPHHHHFICTSCHTIEDIQDEKLEYAIQAVADTMVRAGRSVSHHQFKLYGVCASCT